MTEENHEKTSVRLVGTGVRTRDLPNASLVRYHGATSLGQICIAKRQNDETRKSELSRQSVGLNLDHLGSN